MSKKIDAWEVFLADLSPGARAAMDNFERNPLAPPRPPAPPEDDDSDAYDRFLADLSPGARAAFGGAAPEPPPGSEASTSEARWCVVESPDGEWAQLRAFRNPEGLARRLQQLEGQDTVVWCFYGVPLKLTKGPQRLLTMPGGRQMVQIPVFEGGPVRLVDAEAAGKVAFLETGYVGPPELAEANQPKAEVPVTGGPDDDEDDA